MAHGKMKSVYGIYKKHGRDQFLDAAGYYSCHVHPESVDKSHRVQKKETYRSITNASLDTAEVRMENPRSIPNKQL